MDNKTYRIGDFAEFSGISKRMLRHYDKLDLIKPASLDQTNGYRYYNASQVDEVKKIRHLQDFGFSLKEIQRLLSLPLTVEAFMDILKDKEAHLRVEADTTTRQLLKLQHFITFVGKNPGQINYVSDDTFTIIKENERDLTQVPEKRSVPMINQEMREELYKVQNTLGFNEFIDTSISKHPESLKTMVILDIDRFASINDRYGFDAGDMVIYQTYKFFKKSFQALLKAPESRLVRIGGDEFGVYLIDTTKKDIITACKEALTNIHDYDFNQHGINEKLSASIGIFHSYDVKHSKELYHMSTKALLDAKRKGRNTYSVLEIDD